MFLKEVDEKKTIDNVKAFFDEDFDRLQRLSMADTLVRTNDPSKIINQGSHNSDSLNIKHYTYKTLYEVIISAIDKCSDKNKSLLWQKYIEGKKNMAIAMNLHISLATYYKRAVKRAYLEFNECLFEVKSEINVRNTIDIHVYKK